MTIPRSRWLPVAVFTATLSAVYIASGVIINVGDVTDEDTIFRIDVWTIIAVGVLAIGGGIFWGRRATAQRIVSEAGLALLIAGILSVVLGPFAAGDQPFSDGIGQFLIRLLFFWLVTGVGTWAGVMILMVAGADHRSRLLKNTERYYARKTVKK